MAKKELSIAEFGERLGRIIGGGVRGGKYLMQKRRESVPTDHSIIRKWGRRELKKRRKRPSAYGELI